MNTIVRTNLCLGICCVSSIVLVYIDGLIVQDIMFTGYLVNSIMSHKRRFKAKNYLSLAEYFQFLNSLIRSYCCIFSPSNSIHVGYYWKNMAIIGLFWANFEPKFEWVPNDFWDGFNEVMCSLSRGKSHSENGSSKPLMSDREGDIIFGFME